MHNYIAHFKAKFIDYKNYTELPAGMYSNGHLAKGTDGEGKARKSGIRIFKLCNSQVKWPLKSYCYASMKMPKFCSQRLKFCAALYTAEKQGLLFHLECLTIFCYC